ncbi:hypothetical protein [Ureibacillus aquaedulcis]|uniref:DUF4401 domain-containing protein n=1 Tax=Ureibacillus aquaedulcis TaxID=3058421 RepID=A0ABT8GVE1_9BACL|nr:hypothetical protein [Ureibacillus sp. BA0131]MDN4495349.1 hypothetical protein [Ureibacillus sp. BA0131]
MANAKKKIVLNEILFWKQNKLLPDHYCDFLMTLYTEGNETELEEGIGSQNSIIATEKRSKFILIILSCIGTAALLFALFMVSALTWAVGIAVGIIAVLLMIFAYRSAKKKEMLSPILHIASALLLFGLSVKVSTEYFPGNQIALYILLITNCLLWLFTGFKFKLLYFSISGVVGLIVLIGYQIIS